MTITPSKAKATLLAAFATVLLVAGSVTSVQAACVYMPHGVWTDAGYGPFDYKINHGNYYVGFSKGYKTNGAGRLYRTRVTTCSGMNCPVAHSPTTSQVNVVVQATGQFPILKSEHIGFDAGGYLEWIICKAAI